MVISVRQSFPQKQVGGVLYPVKRRRATVSAAISIDASSTFGPAPGSGVALSWSHTVAAGATCLIVAIAYGQNPLSSSPTVTPTYNGIAMTSLGRQTDSFYNAGFVELFYLMSPASGAHTIATGLVGVGGVSLLGAATSWLGVSAVSAATKDDGDGVSSFTENVPSAAGHVVVLAAATGTSFVDVVAPAVADKLQNDNPNSASGNLLLAHSASTGSPTSILVHIGGPDTYQSVAVDLS